MIYVNIRGGLGNQILQYIAARNLGTRLNTKVCIDKSFYDNIKKETTARDFQLDDFNIRAEFMSDDLINKVRKSHTFFNKMISTFRSNKIRVVNEGDVEAQEIFQNPKDNVYLRGYWHKYEYFAQVRESIAGDFSLSYELSDEQSKLEEMVSNSNSVSVHIRRSDYINKDNLQRYGKCDENYYSEAMKHIEREISDPSYFIFSDDIAWCRENILSHNKINYVSLGIDSRPSFEIYLMGKCYHNIIANSSFSLCGAVLNSNKKSIIIAPNPWFNIDRDDGSERLGKDWIRMKRNI
jgi:Glycosyl transferase family 11